MNDIHSLSHTKWNCKYHIVFAPKYRSFGGADKTREQMLEYGKQVIEVKKKEFGDALIQLNQPASLYFKIKLHFQSKFLLIF